MHLAGDFIVLGDLGPLGGLADGIDSFFRFLPVWRSPCGGLHSEGWLYLA